MKKEIKKFLVILFASLFTLVALCFTASANSETETTVTDYGGEISTDETDGTLNQNIFEIIYREGIKHSDKILSLLAFVTSLILALSYKKSLIPFIKGALSKLGSSVNKITEDSESKTDKALISLNDAKSSLEESRELFISAVSVLESICEKLDRTKNLTKINSDLKILMQNQTDMLYEVFISSSLPVYQKEAVGERIKEMKRLIDEPMGEEE